MGGTYYQQDRTPYRSSRASRSVLALLLGVFCFALSVVASAQSGATTGAIEGVVSGPNGPVSGALVAAVPLHSAGLSEQSTRAAGITESAAGGKFRLERLKPGDYALTATAPGMAAAFLANLTVRENQPLKNIQLTLGAGENTFKGILRGPDGQPLSQSELRAVRSSKEDGDIFFARANAKGEFSITLPAARYTLLVSAPGYSSATQRNLEAKGVKTVDLVLDRQGPAPAFVSDWIREHAIAIKTPEAGHGFDDLQPLKKIIGDARLVSLGEATHGTREFFQMKHRMLEFLVGEMGFNIFAIEATMPESFDINEYVLTGKGDPAKALSALYFWTWDTEEVLNMIEWMRQYNADARHAKKVKFYGFDMQFAPRAAKVTLAYLRKANPDQAKRVQSTLDALYPPILSPGDYPKSRQDAFATDLTEILKDLDQNKESYIQHTSQEEWARARLHARILQQCLELKAKNSSAVRDKAMAENIRWIMEHEAPGSKMVVWAHNYHVSRPQNGGTMGSHLSRAFGPQMVVLGFAFNQGSFQAFDAQVESGKGVHVFAVPPAQPGSLDATVAAAGVKLAALDLHALPPDGQIRGWFERPHLTRIIGSTFSDKTPEQFAESQIVTQEYDGLLFVENTSSAHPLAPNYHQPILPEPSNLDFELGTSVGIPEGWAVYPQYFMLHGYHAKMTAVNPQHGGRSMEISRDMTAHYGEFPGTVSQKIDATKFRGKRIRLSGWFRGELHDDLSSAHLSLLIESRNPFALNRTYDAMTDKPPVTGTWQLYEATADVPNDAATISYNISMVGDGRIWADNVSLEIVSPVESSKAP
jgi:erythromycin esterase